MGLRNEKATGKIGRRTEPYTCIAVTFSDSIHPFNPQRSVRRDQLIPYRSFNRAVSVATTAFELHCISG